MPLRVIARRVSVNVGIAAMNRDIIPGNGDTVLVAGFAGGSDLDRLVFWRLDINGDAATSSHKKNKKKDCCPRSHGAPRRYRRAKALQRRKGPSRFRLGGAYSSERTGVYMLLGKAGQSRLRRVIPPVCWSRPQ